MDLHQLLALVTDSVPSMLSDMAGALPLARPTQASCPELLGFGCPAQRLDKIYSKRVCIENSSRCQSPKAQLNIFHQAEQGALAS